MGYVRAARALLPTMIERRWGRIINVIGLGAYQANPQYLAGGAINASLLAVTRTLARTVAHAGVTVNGINPGPTATPRFNDLVRQRAEKYGKSIEEEFAASMSKVPMGVRERLRNAPRSLLSSLPNARATSAARLSE